MRDAAQSWLDSVELNIGATDAVYLSGTVVLMARLPSACSRSVSPRSTKVEGANWGADRDFVCSAGGEGGVDLAPCSTRSTSA